jgi:hypothetical protein
MVRAVLASLVLAVTMAVAVVPSAAGTRTAKLRVIDLTPVTVKGLRFHAGERVRVALYANGRQVRRIRATRSGSFVVRFTFLADYCTAFNLRAVGASGAVAVAARKRPPECAPLDPIIG